MSILTYADNQSPRGFQRDIIEKYAINSFNIELIDMKSPSHYEKLSFGGLAVSYNKQGRLTSQVIPQSTKPEYN